MYSNQERSHNITRYNMFNVNFLYIYEPKPPLSMKILYVKLQRSIQVTAQLNHIIMIVVSPPV